MGTEGETRYYIVSAEALPEIFVKVAQAKRMLSTGEAATVGEAAGRAGISRSAFYKYRDAVQPFHDMKVGRIVTFYAMLRDTPGVLSNILNIFAGSGANILTINQFIPSDGCAAATVSVETGGLTMSPDELASRLKSADGVVKLEILAG